MSDPTILDLRRELQKTRDVLVAAQTHLAAHAESNAALHCATTVMYSPLHARVTAAIAGADSALNRTAPALAVEPGADLASSVERDIKMQLSDVLLNLDRCAHGRHEGDVCGDCGVLSCGNPHMPAGNIIGYDIHGQPIVMPDREHKHDPAAWRGQPTATAPGGGQ